MKMDKQGAFDDAKVADPATLKKADEAHAATPAKTDGATAPARREGRSPDRNS